MCICSTIVTKPKSEPPPRPTPPRASIPPPRPPNPIAHSRNEDQNQIPLNSNAMPDITQNQEADLLNLSSARKEPSFDLLGSFETAEAQENNMPDLLSDSKAKVSGLDDIFGASNQSAYSNIANMPDLNAVGANFTATNTNVSNSDMNFDPFGDESLLMGNASLLQPTSKETSPSQSHPTPSQTNKDPFADMANLASGLNLNWGNQQKNTTPIISPISTQFSSPTHQFGGIANQTTSQSSTSPIQEAQSPLENQPKADYSRSHFDQKPKQNGAGSTANSGDIFADILGQQGYNFATKPQNTPRSINEMRKEELVKDMDPDKLRIMEWV